MVAAQSLVVDQAAPAVVVAPAVDQVEAAHQDLVAAVHQDLEAAAQKLYLQLNQLIIT